MVSNSIICRTFEKENYGSPHDVSLCYLHSDSKWQWRSVHIQLNNHRKWTMMYRLRLDFQIWFRHFTDWEIGSIRHRCFVYDVRMCAAKIKMIEWTTRVIRLCVNNGQCHTGSWYRIANNSNGQRLHCMLDERSANKKGTIRRLVSTGDWQHNG